MELTRSEEIVITKLAERQGNVQATAAALDVSESYINRIKKRYEQPVVEIGGETIILLQPDIPRIEGLRSLVVDYLSDLMADKKMSAKEAINLLQAILQYELNQRGLAQGPRVTVNDNRSQFQLNALVDSLARLGPDALRALVGSNKGDVIDG